MCPVSLIETVYLRVNSPLCGTRLFIENAVAPTGQKSPLFGWLKQRRANLWTGLASQIQRITMMIISYDTWP